jgi:hypothetical protein
MKICKRSAFYFNPGSRNSSKYSSWAQCHIDRRPIQTGGFSAALLRHPWYQENRESTPKLPAERSRRIEGNANFAGNGSFSNGIEDGLSKNRGILPLWEPALVLAGVFAF